MATLTGERLDFDPRDAATAAELEWGSCEWTVSHGQWLPNAPFRTMAEVRTCGRYAGRRSSDHMFLCWQHREKWIREAALLIADGAISVADSSELIAAVVRRIDRFEEKADAEEKRYIGRVIALLLAATAEDPERHSPHLREAVNRLVDQRLKERIESEWGALDD